MSHAGDMRAFIVKDVSDIPLLEKVLAEKPVDIFSFSNPASVILSGKGYNPRKTTGLYSDISHIRTAILQDKCLKLLESGAGLDPLVAEALRTDLYYFIGTASFLYHSLARHRDYLWVGKEGKVEKGNHAQAFSYLMGYYLGRKYRKRVHYIPRFHAAVLSSYNKLVARALRKKTKLLMIDGGRPSSAAFAVAVKGLEPSAKVLVAKTWHRGFSSNLWKIICGIGSLARKNGGAITYFYWSERGSSLSGKINQLVEGFPGKLPGILLKELQGEILDFAEYYSGQLAVVKKHTAALSPQLVSTDAIAGSYAVMVAATAKAQGGKVVFFNHGTASYQPSGVAALVTGCWSSLGRIQSSHATHHVLRSPMVWELFSKNYHGEERGIMLALDNSVLRKPEKRAGKFTILFAGNYMDFSAHVPWILETADEFAEGILALAEAVSGLAGVELVVRIQTRRRSNSHELDTGFLQRELAKYPNVIVDGDGSFSEALSRADLLVASLTTTIEEALQAGVPVLLHNARMRYRFVPAMEETPGNGKRAAVYSTSRGRDIAALLEGIVAAHKDKPLTKEELAPYCRVEGGKGIREIASFILK